MTVRRRLSSAFRRAYETAGLSQEAISAALGIRQATISKYARGEVQPPIDFLEQVDRLVGHPRGHVLRLAGYVDDGVDLVAAIATDPTLNEDGREFVLHAYRFSQGVAAEERNGEPTVEELAAIGPPFDPWEAKVWGDPDMLEADKRGLILRHRRDLLRGDDQDVESQAS